MQKQQPRRLMRMLPLHRLHLRHPRQHPCQRLQTHLPEFEVQIFYLVNGVHGGKEALILRMSTTGLSLTLAG